MAVEASISNQTSPPGFPVGSPSGRSGGFFVLATELSSQLAYPHPCSRHLASYPAVPHTLRALLMSLLLSAVPVTESASTFSEARELGAASLSQCSVREALSAQKSLEVNIAGGVGQGRGRGGRAEGKCDQMSLGSRTDRPGGTSRKDRAIGTGVESEAPSPLLQGPLF